MNNLPSLPPAESAPQGFSILGIIFRIVMILGVGGFLLMVAGFLGLLFLIMLYLGFQIVTIVVGMVILIFTGGS